jgi:imidazolonepropionase-like amidohydrolase
MTTSAEDLTPGRPVVFRNALVLTMDNTHSILNGGDVLVSGDRIVAVGSGLDVPDGTVEIDGTGGILMPGMVDTHRHMWQTAMRGYGADWTLTQYFVWYYLQSGKLFRPGQARARRLGRRHAPRDPRAASDRQPLHVQGIRRLEVHGRSRRPGLMVPAGPGFWAGRDRAEMNSCRPKVAGDSPSGWGSQRSSM